jgi:hypothetical protein
MGDSFPWEKVDGPEAGHSLLVFDNISSRRGTCTATEYLILPYIIVMHYLNMSDVQIFYLHEYNPEILDTMSSPLWSGGL